MIIERNGMSGCACGSSGNCGCGSGLGQTWTGTYSDILTGAQEYLTPTALPTAFSSALSPLNIYALLGLAIVPIGLIMLLKGKKAF